MKATLALLALSAGLLAACSDDTHTGATPAYLFILDAPHGEVMEVAGGFELLLPADQAVTWFTDRPVRQADNLTLAQLADAWDVDGYMADPPQAAIDLVMDGHDETFVVELGVPHLEGDMFHIPLADVQTENTEVAVHAGREATLDVQAGHYEEISMFIDSTHDCSICEVAAA